MADGEERLRHREEEREERERLVLTTARGRTMQPSRNLGPSCTAREHLPYYKVNSKLFSTDQAIPTGR